MHIVIDTNLIFNDRQRTGPNNYFLFYIINLPRRYLQVGAQGLSGAVTASSRGHRHRLHQSIKVTTRTFHSLLPREQEIAGGGQSDRTNLELEIN